MITHFIRMWEVSWKMETDGAVPYFLIVLGRGMGMS